MPIPSSPSHSHSAHNRPTHIQANSAARPSLPANASDQARAAHAAHKPETPGQSANAPGQLKKADVEQEATAAAAEPAIELENAQTQATNQQTELNRSIIESQLEVSVSAGDRPQELLYKTALEALRAELEPVLGPNAIEDAYDAGLDVSPEATAGRIVSLTTGLFSLYQDQNPDLSQDQQLDRFLEVIGGGIDTGFGEAREILDGLGVLEGEIASNIDKTYTLVQEGLQAFRDSFNRTDETEIATAEELAVTDTGPTEAPEQTNTLSSRSESS